jgi:ABC-2 type transport system permease protein
MKLFFSIVKKEFLHIFRDTWTMAILLLLPVMMLILFGYAISTEVRGAQIAVYDPSHDTSTEALIERLKTSEFFSITHLIKDPREIHDLFRTNGTDLVLIFDGSFEEKLFHSGAAEIQLITDGTDPNKASTLVQYVSGIITRWQQEQLPTSGLPYSIGTEIRLLYNPTMKGSYNFVPGVMGMILMLVCAMMTSVSIAREKETGTMELLLVSPIKPLGVILAKTVPYLFVSFFNLATILLLSRFAIGVPIVGSLTLLLLVSLLFIFVCLALGLLISTVVKTQVVALLISGMALIIPVVLLSGMMFPIENMPLFLRLLSNAVPARWYIQAVKKVMIQGLGPEAVLKETGILAFMAIMFLLLSFKNFKTRLD